MTDYAKKTVADLTEILKSRSLPHTGKKADLVARLTEADKSASTEPEPTSAPTPPEPIAEANLPPPSITSTAFPTAPAPSAPLTETHQPSAPSPTSAPTPDTSLAAATYALNLPTSTIDTELQKRQARAARFGTATEPDSESKDSEAQRALERAKRFGTTGGDSAMGKLDEALPMARERERKRGADASTGMDDPGLKGRGGGKRLRGGRDGRPTGGARQNSHGNRGERPVGVSKGQPAYVSDRDRAAAEARKKKFGA